MYKSQINLVNVCAQLISLRNEHFFGDTFDVLCFHMFKLQAYFENMSVLRILLEKSHAMITPRSAVFSYVQTQSNLNSRQRREICAQKEIN